jgi:cytoskeletal protein RodZ
MSNGAEAAELLWRAREVRGLTIDDLAEMTRLRPSAIRAAEEGDFTMLGGEPYVRGHLRTLAAKLDIDGDALLEAYLAVDGQD